MNLCDLPVEEPGTPRFSALWAIFLTNQNGELHETVRKMDVRKMRRWQCSMLEF